MFEVKVTLEIPGVPEALDRLADAIASQNCGCKSGKAADPINERLTAAMNAAETAAPAQIPVQPAPAPVQAAAPTPVPAAPVRTPAAPVQTPAAQPMPAQTPAGVAPQSAPAPMSAAPAAKKYTRDEIAKAGSVLASQGKIPELLALLNKYGVQSVVQLSPDKYDAFAGDLRALGAAL